MKTMQKKGQMALFLIVGVFLLAIAGIVFYFETTQLDSSGTIEGTLDSSLGPEVKAFVESCLASATEEGMYWIGLQGGYYSPVNAFPYLFFEVPIYFDGRAIIPPLSRVELELGEYIEQNLESCLDDFSNIKQLGVGVITGEFEVDVELGKTVSVVLEFPISLQVENTKVFLDKFFVEHLFDFGQVYSAIEAIHEEHEKNINSVPIGFLSYYVYKHDMTFDMDFLDNNTVLYSLFFHGINNYEDAYVFNFAGRYKWEPNSLSEDMFTQRGGDDE